MTSYRADVNVECFFRGGSFSEVLQRALDYLKTIQEAPGFEVVIEVQWDIPSTPPSPVRGMSVDTA